jgi:PKD repeat protein
LVDGVSGGSLSDDGDVELAGANGSIITTNLSVTVGDSGVGQLNVSDGAWLAQTVAVGRSSGATGSVSIVGVASASRVDIAVNAGSVGTLTIDGGSLMVTDQFTTGSLIVGDQGQGTFLLDSGTVTVDTLIVTNGASSVVNHNGGVLNSAGTAVTNGITYTIGDTIHAATFHLLGGVHSFANGLRISTNSFLTGCGTINGAIVTFGTISNDCGTLTISDVITNNGVIVVASGATTVFASGVENNGLIDATAGNAIFLSTLVNNGTVLTNHVPVSSFTASPTNGPAPLTVTFTDTSTGTITNRFWAFGDGGTTNTLNTTVIYTYNSVGTDTVTLITAGPTGVSTNIQANFISVTNGVPNQVISPGNLDFGIVAVGQTTTQTFSVASIGFGPLNGTATASGAPFTIITGSPYILNSGQTGLVSVGFSPGSVGTFTGSVVFASDGGTSTNLVTGSGAVAPTAGFTGTPTNGAAPLLVNFTDASSGTVTGRVWDFGDGNTSALANPSHSYAIAGSFSVSLTVLGPLGSNTLVLANFITVTNVVGVPVAAFTASPTNGATPLLVNFTDASTGVITNHSWTFGDGNTSVAASPSHSYSTAGVYSVSLTVSGPGGTGITNELNLITVTNAVVAPTVTILRPGDGMLYPPLTNLTITIVANATANDGATISKIEFFADGTKLGQTAANPGTNFFFHPRLGTHVISARATDTFGATNTSSATITIGAKNSPVGDWEVTIGGADKGAQFLTFEDDFTASGFGIRLKSFGLNDVSGRWSFSSKGQVTGPFFEETDSVTNWTGTLLGKVKSLKGITGTVPTDLGTFHWKSITATSFRDLSGTWTGLVTVAKSPTVVSYILANNASDPAVFDIATSDTPGTVVGQLLVTSRNKVYGYITFDNNRINFSGAFSIPKLSLKFKGTDDGGDKITIELFQK